MTRALTAGFAYFLLVFCLGVLLGSIRTLILEPMAGSVLAMVMELPFMLLASWFVCGFLVRHFQVPRHLNERLMMGFVAFAMLMLAEWLLFVLLRELPPLDFLQIFALPERRMG